MPRSRCLDLDPHPPGVSASLLLFPLCTCHLCLSLHLCLVCYFLLSVWTHLSFASCVFEEFVLFQVSPGGYRGCLATPEAVQHLYASIFFRYIQNIVRCTRDYLKLRQAFLPSSTSMTWHPYSIDSIQLSVLILHTLILLISFVHITSIFLCIFGDGSLLCCSIFSLLKDFLGGVFLCLNQESSERESVRMLHRLLRRLRQICDL